MRKSIFSIFVFTIIILFFAGCTLHIGYRTKYQDIETVKEDVALTSPNKIICIYYDDKAFVKFDVRKAYKYDDWAFDYGDAIKKIGEKWFSGYENIKFINVIDKAAQQKKECDMNIFPKVDEAIYTYPRKDFTTQLEVTMSFKIESVDESVSFNKTYHSGVLTVPPASLSEYIYISKVFTEWMRNQIIIVINELGSAKGEPYHENK